MVPFQCTNGSKEALPIGVGQLFPTDVVPITWIWLKSKLLRTLWGWLTTLLYHIPDALSQTANNL